MTFTEISTAVTDYCNLTSSAAVTRVGKAINRHYRRITASLGLDTARFVTRSVSASIGVQTIAVLELEKIDRVLDTTDATSIRLLTEVSIHEIRSTQPGTGAPDRWAFQNADADSVTILLDTIPQAAYSFQADGWTTLAALSGTDEPVFPESYHDILAWYVIAEELLKKEKDKLAATYAAKAESLLRDLRFFLADSHTRTTQQASGRAPISATVSGGGSGNQGGTAYTQSALLTFDRGVGVVPFAVAQATAPYVVNLGAEFLGNITTDRLIGRDTPATGESEQLTVGGGIEFTGTGGIQRSALTGDVTASAGSGATAIGASKVLTSMIAALNVTTATLADDAVTYAKVQNISAASRVLGRGSAGGSGDPQELTIGSGLSLTGTVLDAAVLAPICQGRLTLTSATPVTTSDVTGAGTLYFALYKGDLVALYDGSAWVLYTITERSLALTLTSGKNYDVFLYSNAGTVTLELSAAWTNDTTRADALTLQNGIYVKSGATTRRYLGTLRASGSNTTEDSLAKRYLWNYYHRVPRLLRRLETTGSWTYTTATVRQANAAAANQVDVVVGIAEVRLRLALQVGSRNTNADVLRSVGIGEDSTTTFMAAELNTGIHDGGGTIAIGAAINHIVHLTHYPAIGRHFYSWNEDSAATGTTTWLGTTAPTGGTNALQSGLSGDIDG